jgi:hypothetical protein
MKNEKRSPLQVAAAPAGWHDRYMVVLSCLAREDNWIHYRLMWSIQINVAFIAAVVVTFTSAANGISETALWGGRFVIGLSGIILTFLCLGAIKAACSQNQYLKEYVQDLAAQYGPSTAVPGEADNVIEQLTGYPRPFGADRGFRSGYQVPQNFSHILAFYWGILMAVSLCGMLAPQVLSRWSKTLMLSEKARPPAAKQAPPQAIVENQTPM